jgi:hypothetical protein
VCVCLAISQLARKQIFCIRLEDTPHEVTSDFNEVHGIEANTNDWFLSVRCTSSGISIS